MKDGDAHQHANEDEDQEEDQDGRSNKHETWLESGITSVYERPICARLLAMFQLHAIPFFVIAHNKWLRWIFFVFFEIVAFDVVNPTRCF